MRAAFGRPRTLGVLALTALLIGSNWLLYVYAVTSGHILAASFGYYLNPLANVLLGRFVLKERLTRLQWIAVAIAAAGISVLAAGALGQLWISLTLCASFALYGLLRKIVAADAVDRPRRSKPRSFSRCAIALARAGARRAARPIFGTSTPQTVLLRARRHRLDHAAAAVHRRRPAARLFDARHAAVHRADAAVPDRGLLYGEPFTTRPRDRLPRDLDRARALRRRADPRAAACRRPPE